VPHCGSGLQADGGVAGAALVGETGVTSSKRAGAPGNALSSSAVAVVLTYRRPQWASQVVRDLLGSEGLDPSEVVLVVNGEGGLDDPELEKAISVLSLPSNLGPAGAFAEAMKYARDRSTAPWIYLCEDDQTDYHGLPSPRLRSLIDEVERFQREVPGPPVGGVLASGRNVDMRTGRTHRLDVSSSGARLHEADFGPWWGTLLSRSVVDEGIYPDENLFWWAEDLEFWLRVRATGFRVLVDRVSHKAARHKASSGEPWCGYYMARNQFYLRRRYGNFRWTILHLMKTVRRLQLAPSRAHRLAIVKGFADGLRGRLGRNTEFSR
jgi:GT2 family glycosyltransferase